MLEHHQVDYSVPGMNKWLHHNGFSYKQPKGIPHKFDEDKQQAFVDSYETLKASCGKEESIIFIDAVHPTLSTKISHGWIRTGQDKNLKTTGNRSRLNLIVWNKVVSRQDKLKVVLSLVRLRYGKLNEVRSVGHDDIKRCDKAFLSMR